MADVQPGEGRRESRPVVTGGLVERRPEAAVAGVDAERPARLGVDEGQLTDVGERLLARVGDLEGDDRVPGGHLGERPDPVARAAEVGGDDDDAGRRARRAHEGQGAGRRGHAAALLGGFRRESPEKPEHAAPAAGRGA